MYNIIAVILSFLKFFRFVTVSFLYIYIISKTVPFRFFRHDLDGDDYGRVGTFCNGTEKIALKIDQYDF